jgi:hypothetical protein
MDIIHRPVFYSKLSSTYRIVRNAQETHYVSATTPQVNAIYRFVTIVYLNKYHKSGHYPSSWLLFKPRCLGQVKETSSSNKKGT